MEDSLPHTSWFLAGVFPRTPLNFLSASVDLRSALPRYALLTLLAASASSPFEVPLARFQRVEEPGAGNPTSGKAEENLVSRGDPSLPDRDDFIRAATTRAWLCSSAAFNYHADAARPSNFPRPRLRHFVTRGLASPNHSALAIVAVTNDISRSPIFLCVSQPTEIIRSSLTAFTLNVFTG